MDRQGVNNIEGRAMPSRVAVGLVFGAVMMVAGCATSTRPVASRVETIDRPALNEIATANLGDSLLTRGIVFWRQAIRTSGPSQINVGLGNTLTAPQGTYVLRAEDDKARYFTGGPPILSGGNVLVAAGGFPDGGICVARGADTIVGVFMTQGICGDKNLAAASFQSVTVPDDTVANIWRKELIYNGRSGDTIKVIYREYTSGDLARPAFTQELQYDLSQQTEIGFREARLQVESATNTVIRYRVLQPFNDTQP